MYRGHVSVDRLALLGALPLLLAAAPARAQPATVAPGAADAAPSASADAPAPDPSAPLAANEAGFTADSLEYDSDADIVTATGNVHMVRNGDRMRADKVVWNRATGSVHASGNVVVTNPGGDTVYGDNAELTDSLKDGVVENLLFVLADGGRLAARHGRRVAGVSTLDYGAYSPCSVVCDDGVKPREPLWKITAVRIVHDPQRHRVYYRDAELHMFGMPVLWLPQFSHPDGSGQGSSGLLIPKLNYNHVNGFELDAPYYWRIAPNRDLTFTPHIYSLVAPMAEVQYRQLLSNGAFQVGGDLTYSRQVPIGSVSAVGDNKIRGYFDASGQLVLSPYWTLTGSVRLATDKTFLLRYGISGDDRLRSVINAERIDDDSYLSIAGWYFQSLRVGETQGQQPIALPVIDYRRRIQDPWLGGHFELEANTLAITRTEGQDTQRAFASARWDLQKLTQLGQEVTFTLYSRGDLYRTDETGATDVVAYRGMSGWQKRGIVAAAVDMRWPFIGPAFGDGTQQVTPRVQLVASPHTKNLAIPNEDARAVNLDDSNLFALNRFPGYDRWEDGPRVTYGLDYKLTLPRFMVDGNIGQSYRLNSRPSLFTQGTGLTDRLSDIVGRFTIKYGSLVSIVERFRLDKDDFHVRTNEIDATIGSNKSYITAGYLHLNRDIAQSIEDVRDDSELRLGGRVQLLRHWSLYGTSTIDLTTKHEDPTSTTDGYQPVRHRVGLAYEDECFQFGVNWQRTYVLVGDARAGNTFSLTLAFKNLGR